jgi:hypothetical protein
MKIHHIVGAPSIILTNEERDFIKNHHKEIPIKSLYDREEVLARNLVRKGVYEISNDSTLIVLKTNDSDRSTLI